MKKFWHHDEDEYLRAHYPSGDWGNIAGHLGRTVKSVSRRAEYLKIKRGGSVCSGKKGRPATDWSVHDHLLGKMSDAALATMMGISTSTVHLRRQALGVESYNRRPAVVDWNLVDSLLGKMSDRDIARRIGCSAMAIFRRRKSLGIPKYKKNKNLRVRQPRVRVDAQIHRFLAIAPDPLIATVFGLSKQIIADLRNKLQIPSWKEAHRAPPGKMPWHHREVEIVQRFPHLVACRLLPWRTREAVRSKRRETAVADVELLEWAVQQAIKTLEAERRSQNQPAESGNEGES